MTGRIAACAPLALLLSSFASQVQGQSGDEVIADPELAGPSAKPSNGNDEAIMDPELAGSGGGGGRSGTADNGWGEAAREFQGGGPTALPTPSEEDAYDPQANTGVAKIEVVGQQGVDINKENYLEDFFESRLRFGGETDFRISRKLRLSTGARLDFFFASPNPGDADIPEGKRAWDFARYEFDVIPLSMYTDYTAADGVHLRVGVQPVSLGRMDFISPVDMLSVVDLRPSPKADPSAMKLSQMAVKLDWDLSTWATLQLVYVPWFMPHLNRPNQDRFVGAASTGIGAARQENPYAWMLSPSQQPRFTESTIRYAGPAPDFTHPQAEARLNMRGSTFEVAVFGGTALEKVPIGYYAPVVAKYLASFPSGEGDDAFQQQLAKDHAKYQGDIALGLGVNNAALLDITYPRYLMAGFDGSLDIAPLSIGFEVGYSPSRMLYTVSRDGSTPPLPNTSVPIGDPPAPCLTATKVEVAKGEQNPCGAPYTGQARDPKIRKGVPLVTGGLHIEYLKGEQLALVLEAIVSQTFEMPYDNGRDWAGYIKGTGTFAAGIFGGSYQFGEAERWRVGGSVMVLPGPSLIAMPILEVKLTDGFYANVGLQIYEGPRPGNIPVASKANAFATNLTAGGVFSGYDQATVGFRWLPGS